MATGTTFPTTLDSFTNKADGIDDILATETNTQSSALEALEAKVGVTNSADTNSLDYKINNSLTNPMTTRGDIIYRNSLNSTSRLALGAKGSLLKSDGLDLGYFAKGSLNQVLTNSDTDNEYKDILQVLALAGKQSAIISFAEAGSTDGYAAYLSPGGASNLTTSLLGATTPFVSYNNGVKKTISSDLTVAITAGYGSNNTLLINEAAWTGASAQEIQSKVFGEKAHASVIMNFDTAGSNISGLSVGDKVVFRAVNSSAAVEYIYCEMVTVGASGTLRILWRAIDSSGVRITFRDNDTWTLCRTNWIFTDGTSLYATTVHPVEVDTLPSAGTAGKYILLKSTDTWYLDNGASVSVTDRILVGASFSHNTTDNGAVGYLPEWGHFKYQFLRMKKGDVQIKIDIDNLSTSKGLLINGTVQIADKIFKYKDTRVNTATSGDRIDSTADIAAIGVKYVYASYTTGKLYLSDVMPRKWDDGVFMHPNKMYRCIGYRFHSASAFYYVSMNGLIFHYPDLVLNASVGNTMANYTVFGGYCPSWIESLITNTDHGSTTTAYTADYYTSTTDRIIATGINYQYIAQLNPLFSGYARVRGSSAGVNWNHIGYISGMGLGHG